MSDIVQVHSIAELVVPQAMTGAVSISGTGASTSTGFTIDREGFSTGSLPRSADMFVAFDTTLSSGATLTLAFDVQDSADGTNFSDYQTNIGVVVATGVSGGGEVVNCARVLNPSGNAPAGTAGVDLGGARRYVRLNWVATLSASNTAVMFGVGEFGGFDTLSAPAAGQAKT